MVQYCRCDNKTWNRRKRGDSWIIIVSFKSTRSNFVSDICIQATLPGVRHWPTSVRVRRRDVLIIPLSPRTPYIRSLKLHSSSDKPEARRKYVGVREYSCRTTSLSLLVDCVLRSVRYLYVHLRLGPGNTYPRRSSRLRGLETAGRFSSPRWRRTWEHSRLHSI